MSNLRFEGDIGFVDKRYFVSLSLIEFKEDDVTIVYSPALDLSGYGYSSEEAKNPFNIALHEFLRYTSNKNTVNDILKDLGWKIKGSKKNPKYQPPLNTELVNKNALYSDILNSKNYKVFNEDVEFAF